MARIQIKLDRKLIKYGIIVENFVHLIEMIGGFYHSIHTICFFLVIFFQERMLKSSFFKQIYSIIPDAYIDYVV